MHPRIAALLLLAIAACSSSKDQDNVPPADICTRAILNGVQLIQTEFDKHAAFAARDCGLMSTETLNCTIAATDVPALTTCFDKAMTGALELRPGGRPEPDSELCTRSAANQRKVMFAALDAARRPRIEACRAAKSAHASCQSEAKTAMDWMKCDPDAPPLAQ